MAYAKTYAILSLAFTALASCAAPKSDLALFTERFEKLKQTEEIYYSWWRKPFNPFAPYLDKKFLDGLPPSRLKLYEKAKARLNCDAVRDLAREGFLNLHPHLKPAFAREDVRDSFNRMIALRHFLPLRHCSARKKIADARLFAKDHGITLPPFRMEEFLSENLHKQDPPLTKKERWAFHNRCAGIAELLLLALEKQYAPSIRAMLELMRGRKAIRLTPLEEYFLYRAAEAEGVLPESKRGYEEEIGKSLSADDIKLIGDSLGLAEKMRLLRFLNFGVNCGKAYDNLYSAPLP